jgi:hypothetical protein
MWGGLATRSGIALLVSAACAFIPGCLILPDSEPISTPVTGMVIDAATSEPIAGAKVTATRAQYRASVASDRQGNYKLPALRQWTWLVYAGDPGVFPSPIYISNHNAPLVVSVRAAGHEPAQRLFDTAALVYSEPPGPDDRPVNFKLTPQPARP